MEHIYVWLDLQKPSEIAQKLKANLLLNIKPTLLHYQKHGYRWSSLLSQTNPVKPPRYTTGSVGPVNDINQKVSGARLLSTIPLDKSDKHEDPVHLYECDGSSD